MEKLGLDSIRVNTEDLDDISYVMTGQDDKLEDPLDDTIITNLKIICCLSGDSRHDLVQKYTSLISLTRGNPSGIVDDLKNGVMEGYPTLLNMIKIAITSYSVVAAMNYTSAVTSLSVMQTELFSMVIDAHKQQNATKESLEHLCVSWNNFTGSMTHFTAELEKRTLNLSNLNQTPSQRYATPSADSKHTSDDKVGCIMRLTPGFRYLSILGCLTCDASGDVGFVATNITGQYIGKIVGLITSPKVLEKIMNRDIEKLADHPRVND